jgi:hypothetical protein
MGWGWWNNKRSSIGNENDTRPGGVAVRGGSRSNFSCRFLATCSAEDLLTHKVFAGRNIDWGDAEQILIRQHGRLDLEQVRAELKPLLELKGQPETMLKLDGLIAAADRRLHSKP